MKIDRIVVGNLQENCYLLEKNQKYLLVDPGEDITKILEFIKEKNIIGILITHHHHDHIGALQTIIDKYHYPIYDSNNLKEEIKNIGPFQIEIIPMKGHSKDMLCYYFKEDKIMLTGDFLFKGTIGRCDLEGGNELEMKESLKKIKQYDDNIIIYPGHGPSTTLKEEKLHNIYLKNE